MMVAARLHRAVRTQKSLLHVGTACERDAVTIARQPTNISPVKGRTLTFKAKRERIASTLWPLARGP
jgi:hypothetical protein